MTRRYSEEHIKRTPAERFAREYGYDDPLLARQYHTQYHTPQDYPLEEEYEEREVTTEYLESIQLEMRRIMQHGRWR